MLKVLIFASVTSVAMASCFAPPTGGGSPKQKVSKRSARPTAAQVGRSWYVSPSGTPAGSGSFESPWDLQTALNQPGVQPGDTIWLRGGTYSGAFIGRLNGTPTSPIIVRQYPGERATIDGGSNHENNGILVARGSYTWYWGFEVMSSDPNRFTTETGSAPTAITRGEGVLIDQNAMHPGLKFINLVVHDARQGFGFWKEAEDGEIYGCLIYYNGWEAPDRGHGHGIYTQNQNGTKKIIDNILFSGFSHGIHAYGSTSAPLDNFVIEGNTTFDAGNLSAVGGRNLLLGGGSVAHNPIVNDNFMYRAVSQSDDFNLGYSGGCTNATVTGNYVSNETEFVNCLPVTSVDNTFYGAVSGFSKSQYAANTYYSSRPTGVNVFIRPNAYEAGRANVTIYNWDGLAAVGVDLSAVLSVGAGYEVRNARDFFGAPVLAGTYAGGPLTLPLTGLSAATPVGHASPPPSGNEFNVFVVLTTRDTRQHPVTVSPTGRTTQVPER